MSVLRRDWNDYRDDEVELDGLGGSHFADIARVRLVLSLFGPILSQQLQVLLTHLLSMSKDNCCEVNTPSRESDRVDGCLN